MCKATLGSLALAVLTAGIIGCTGSPRASHPTMASMGGVSSPQIAKQSVLPASVAAKPSEYGKMARQNPSTWGAVTKMLTNNPVNASVQKAWNGMTRPAGTRATGYQSADSAIATDLLALSSQPKEPTASLYTSMGQLAEKYGNIDQARVHYQKALETAPNDTQTLLAYGHLEDRQEQLDKALELYSRAVQSSPSDATARNDLGLCLARKDDMPAAAHALSRAVELQPRRKLYRNNLATILIQLDREDEALAQLMAVNPPAIAHYNMGYMLHKYGNETLALEHFVTASRLDPSMQTAQAWLAKLQPEGKSPVAVENTENMLPPADVPQQETVVVTQSESLQLPVVVGPAVMAVAPAQTVASSPQIKPQVLLPVQSPTPPVPRYAPNTPAFPKQLVPTNGPYRLPTTDYPPRQAVVPVEPSQSPWPLHQPSEVPNTNLGASAAQPPVPAIPATVTNAYVDQLPQPLPPVQQASASGIIRR